MHIVRTGLPEMARRRFPFVMRLIRLYFGMLWAISGAFMGPGPVCQCVWCYFVIAFPKRLLEVFHRVTISKTYKNTELLDTLSYLFYIRCNTICLFDPHLSISIQDKLYNVKFRLTCGCPHLSISTLFFLYIKKCGLFEGTLNNCIGCPM